MGFDDVENFFSVEIVVVGIFHDGADIVVVVEELFERAFVFVFGMYHKGVRIDFNVEFSHAMDAPDVNQIQCRNDVFACFCQMIFDAQRNLVILNPFN